MEEVTAVSEEFPAFAHSKVVDQGRRLIPHVVDQLMVSNPDHVFGMMAKSANISEGFIKFTALQLSNAVDYMAHFLDNIIGRENPITFTPIIYIGEQDFRYWVMELAAMKTFRPLLLPGTQNALQNTISFIGTTDAKILFWSGRMKDQAYSLLSAIPGLAIHEIPSLEQMYSIPSPHYPYDKTFEAAKNDPALIVHTSGSTGNPKPIIYTHDWLTRCDDDIFTPPVPGRVLSNPAIVRPYTLQYAATPFFHLSGIGFGFIAMLRPMTLVMGPSSQPPSGRIACDLAKAVKLNGFITVPSACDAIFGEFGNEMLPYLGSLDHIIWLGGPLAKSTGDWIVANTTAILWQIYGSTEMAWIPLLVTPRTHWEYLEFHPTLGPTMERIHPASDLYEVVQHRLPDPSHAWARPIFKIFPNMQEWRSRDLFRRCTEEGENNLWLYQGRVDDIMVMHNGLKVNPLHVEMKLLMHPDLSGSVVFGTGYTQCGILLEPRDFRLRKDELVERVWGAIEAANRTVPVHAKVWRHLIVVADKQRNFVRSAKGGVVRKATVDLYKQDIANVYGGSPKGLKE